MFFFFSPQYPSSEDGIVSGRETPIQLINSSICVLQVTHTYSCFIESFHWNSINLWHDTVVYAKSICCHFDYEAPKNLISKWVSIFVAPFTLTSFNAVNVNKMSVSYVLMTSFHSNRLSHSKSQMTMPKFGSFTLRFGSVDCCWNMEWTVGWC